MQKKIYLQYVCCFILLLSAYTSNAQTDTIVKYFDTNWHRVKKESATYIEKFVKQGNLYYCTTYWASSQKLYSTQYVSDTSSMKRIGIYRSFFENGQTEDSTFYSSPDVYGYSYEYYENGKLADSAIYDNKGNTVSAYHYYEDGKLSAHFYYNSTTDKEITDGYDENGKKIKDYIYEREASFPGKETAWSDFLGSKIKTNVPIKNGAPTGSYTVFIKFIVSKDGTITTVEPDSNIGYGMEDEVMRVIKKSPKWIPAIQYNRPVNAYRRQPITFVVDEK